ncbi:MAG TPA: RpiB/LacA/LacB family sugar-phosphate isomerase [Methanosarcina sp.]|nr:RpiB/LacA/LacB family sugar-phosphate isomerase [Methanosarcina sp.]
MKIYIGADHTGYELKEKLKTYLTELGLGYEVEDKGAFSLNKDDDYPDFVKPVAEAVAGDVQSKGIVLGGSGEGESICANKTKGIRAAIFYGQKEAIAPVDVTGRQSADPFEIVQLAREHNNANILSIGTRFVSEDEAKFAVELFLKTQFSADERHIRRISKID